MKEQGRKKQRRYKSWMKGMFSASLVCSFLTILTGCGFAETGTPTAGTESVIAKAITKIPEKIRCSPDFIDIHAPYGI